MADSENDMENDFFSQFAKNVNGLQITFLVIGTLWVLGTLLSLQNLTFFVFLGWGGVWAGFYGSYFFIKTCKIKSSRLSIWILIVSLLLWKALVGVLIQNIAL